MPQEWMTLLPLLTLATGGTGLFCLGAFLRRPAPRSLYALALATVGCSALAAVVVKPAAGAIFGVLDGGPMALFLDGLLAATALLALLFLHPYAARRRLAGDECYGMMIFAALGMMLVAGAAQWLVFFLGFELLSLALYVLIALRRDQPNSLEAALKYLVMGVVAGAFLAFGIALLYAASGTLEIGGSLAAGAHGDASALTLLGLALVAAGIAFKVSLVPFHLWTPDVYEGAPAPVAALLTTGSKVAVLAAVLRLVLVSPDALWVRWVPVLWLGAAAAMVVGNVTALNQSRLKRLLAYSSIAQMGYVAMGILGVRSDGGCAVLFYLAVYTLMDLGAFGMVGVVSGLANDRDELSDYRGLGFSRPWQSLLLSVCLLSLAGLPPTAGFIGKFVLFQSVFRAGHGTLAFLGILTVVVSLYVYLKVIAVLYLEAAAGKTAADEERAPWSARLAAASLLIALLGLGIHPAPLFGFLSRILTALPPLTSGAG
jgi:NADH-quinone oxidoreductase subunit N